MIRKSDLFILFAWLCINPDFAQSSRDTTISIYFDSGKFIPTDVEIQRVASTLSRLNFRILKIAGFADSVGT